LRVLRLAGRAVLRGSGALVKPRCWLCSIRRLAVGTGIRFPVYDHRADGNVFNWILQASNDFRQIKQRKRYVELKKASAKSEGVDKARVEN
jgi:hypothetical protein